MADLRTLSVYDSAAEEYADIVETDQPYPRLDRFMEALPEGAFVLDLGCGPGTWAARMIARGFDVDAVDASAGMAEVAMKRHGIEVRVAGFDSVDGENIYDGIWAHFSLLHAPREAFPGHLKALARALRPGGQMLLALKLGQGEARDRRDRFYSYYTEDELVRLLSETGFEVLAREFGRDVGLDGEPHDHIALFVTLA